MKELTRIQTIPEINELSGIKLTNSIYVIDFIGNNVPTSLIKREFIGLKSINSVRYDQGRPRIKEERDGVEFNIVENQLLMFGSDMSIVSEDAYCNEDLLRIYSIGYSPDKIKYYAKKILERSSFDNFKIYIGNTNGFLGEKDIEEYTSLYGIEVINFPNNLNLVDFTKHINKNLIYEF